MSSVPETGNAWDCEVKETDLLRGPIGEGSYTSANSRRVAGKCQLSIQPIHTETLDTFRQCQSNDKSCVASCEALRNDEKTKVKFWPSSDDLCALADPVLMNAPPAYLSVTRKPLSESYHFGPDTNLCPTWIRGTLTTSNKVIDNVRTPVRLAVELCLQVLEGQSLQSMV